MATAGRAGGSGGPGFSGLPVAGSRYVVGSGYAQAGAAVIIGEPLLEGLSRVIFEGGTVRDPIESCRIDCACADVPGQGLPVPGIGGYDRQELGHECF